ncbi:hypothetical protein ACQ4N7_30000 [Nodosilinea sp. AN01ver1]|uniref:hypothetical protein n=1 Tax=Nodosilinea sp. AN01ver1 TaxID=3423362 RepID=UPI003D3189A8
MTTTSRYASFWCFKDGIKTALMMFERDKKTNTISPVADWVSGPNGYDFVAKINEWHAETPLTKVIVNDIERIDGEDHPAKRRINSLPVVILPQIILFEGASLYEEKSKSGEFEWGDYKGGARLLEKMNQGQSSDPLLMAFLQGLKGPSELVTIERLEAMTG